MISSPEAVKRLLRRGVAKKQHAPILRFNPLNQTSHNNTESSPHLNSYHPSAQAASPGSSNATVGNDNDDIKMTCNTLEFIKPGVVGGHAREGNRVEGYLTE